MEAGDSMLYGFGANSSKEATLFPPAIQTGLSYACTTDFSAMSLGRHTVDGGNMIVLVQEYTTSLSNPHKVETHVRYVDIHYVLQGEEMIGYSSANVSPVLVDTSAEQDIIYFNAVDEILAPLKAGMYAVFFPWEIHRPGHIAAESSDVRKVVVKALSSSL
jgi:YhcH/YjgK/YiaL family protein